MHSCHEVGKSDIAARAAAWWIDCHPPGEAFVVTSAPTAPQVKAVLWRYIRRAHSSGRLPGRVNQVEWMLTPEGKPEELVGYGRKPSDVDPSAFQGIHARFVLLIFDEAGGIPRSLWDAGESLVANENSRFLAIGNPDDPSSEFAEVCKPGSGWNVIGISAFESPNFTGEPVPSWLSPLLISPTWVEERKRRWGESSPVYQAKVLGRFPVVSTDRLIQPDWIKAAQLRELEPGEPHEFGMDVGGGRAESVTYERWGNVARLRYADTEPDTMKSTGKLVAHMRTAGVSAAKVDYVGIGQGVVDRAKELGVSAYGVRVGIPPIHARDGEKFANLRAQGFWELRERFQEGLIDIDPDDDDLAAQLGSLKYKYTSKGQLVIESKDEMKGRGLPSPDRADALMLAMLDMSRVGIRRRKPKLVIC